MVSVSFLYPSFLLFLLIVPLFILVYFWGIFYNKKRSVLYSNFEALERISGIEIFSKNYLMLYLNIIILCLMVFSISGAVLNYTATTSSFSYVLAIDNSGSMSAVDISPNRLEAAKNAANRFVELLPAGVEVGVIEFSGDAKIQQNLDTSKLKTQSAISSVSFGEVQGTNIYNAIIVSNKLFGTKTMKSLILISDGQLNVGDTLDIINYAKRNHIVINSIAIGTKEGGVAEFNTVSKVDEDVLKSLALETNGRFFSANSLTNFDDSFNYLLKEVEKEVSIDISLYLMIAALVLFAFSWLLINFRFKIFP
ncbi:MAG: VWA domain-containing protein [Nanoarchaeota archaeon]|nr:VWA domain-containing protein [Nanoarchaeota archaeon]